MKMLAKTTLFVITMVLIAAVALASNPDTGGEPNESCLVLP
jgi:hypothetical protein